MKIGVLTDSHLCPPGTPPDGCHNPYAFDAAEGMLADAIAAHLADGVGAMAILGDLANRGDFASLSRAIRIVARAGVPLWLVGGNHDRDEDPGHLRTLARELGGTIVTTGGEIAEDFRVAALPIDGGTSSADWTVEIPDVVAWGRDPVLLLSHFPVISRANCIAEAGFEYVGGFVNGASFVPQLTDRRAPTIVIHGHLHLRDATTVGNLLQISCAPLIEPPHDRTVLEIEVNDTAVTANLSHISVAASRVPRLPVLAPARARWVFKDAEWEEVTHDEQGAAGRAQSTPQ